jgi:RNA polymerase sigma-70 factor (ECF subfamily)
MTNIAEFEEFMRNYQDMVYSHALRLLGSHADAADISQEVFLKAYERYAELSASTRRAGWLKTVTTNLCLNHLSRYRWRWRFFSEMISHSHEHEEENYSDSLPAPQAEEPALDTYEQQALHHALQRLPAAQRVPLVLYHFEEMSYDEIARQLGVSIGKVKTDIHRGRETLRNKLRMDRDGNITGPAAELPPTPPPRRGTLMGFV